MDIQKSEAEAIAALATAAETIDYLETDADGVPLVIVPTGYEVKDLSHLLATPKRIKAHPVFISLESFNRYIAQFKEGGTMISVMRDGCASATLDGNLPDAPEWGQHQAAFKITMSERWTCWEGRNKKSFSQKDFAEFIEDNTPDFLAPSAGDMLDMARTLEAEVGSTFKSALKDMSTGDVAFAFERTTTAKAGLKGDLSIPSKFTIQIPILEGESPRPLDVRLRYELSEGKVTFSYEILNRARLLEDVRRSVFATIQNETGVQPFLI